MRHILLNDSGSSKQTIENEWKIVSQLEQQKDNPECERFKNELSDLWKWKEELHKLQCIKKEIEQYYFFWL